MMSKIKVIEWKLCQNTFFLVPGVKALPHAVYENSGLKWSSDRNLSFSRVAMYYGGTGVRSSQVEKISDSAVISQIEIKFVVMFYQSQVC